MEPSPPESSPDGLDDALFQPSPPPASSLSDPRSRAKYEVTITPPDERPKGFVNWRYVGTGLALLVFNLVLLALGTIWFWGWAAAVGFILVGVIFKDH